jgi:hypothetical protein
MTHQQMETDIDLEQAVWQTLPPKFRDFALIKLLIKAWGRGDRKGLLACVKRESWKLINRSDAGPTRRTIGRRRAWLPQP